MLFCYLSKYRRLGCDIIVPAPCSVMHERDSEGKTVYLQLEIRRNTGKYRISHGTQKLRVRIIYRLLFIYSRQRLRNPREWAIALSTSETFPKYVDQVIFFYKPCFQKLMILLRKRSAIASNSESCLGETVNEV